MDELFQIEESIQSLYYKFIKLEYNGNLDSNEYDEYISTLLDFQYQEHQCISNMSQFERLKLKKWLEDNCDMRYSHLETLEKDNTFYYRLINYIDFSRDDIAYKYARVLREDLNNIILAFLDYLINNPAYARIRLGLINYKYSLYFMHPDTEDELICFKDLKNITLQIQNYHSDFPAYVFVDKSILALEGTDHSSLISNLEKDFQDDDQEFLDAVVSTINLLSRLTLCDNTSIDFIYNDLISFLEDEIMPAEIKKLVNDMIALLEEIKNNISLQR